MFYTEEQLSMILSAEAYCWGVEQEVMRDDSKNGLDDPVFDTCCEFLGRVCKLQNGYGQPEYYENVNTPVKVLRCLERMGMA